MKLKGQVALVTGAGTRVGQAIALGLAREGARIAIHYHGSGAGAADTQREAEALGVEARTFVSDLSMSGAPAELVASVLGEMGSLAVLVNSASIMHETPLESLSEQDFDRIMSINLRAPLFLSKAAAEPLGKSGGCIVNISDMSAWNVWPSYTVHGLSKLGMVGLTRYLARLLAPAVRVNCVAPGPVLLPESWSEERAAAVARRLPLGRLGSPDDVVRAVLYLIAADFSTGSVLTVDGGREVG